MSKEVLEKAFEKTKEIEEKQMKKLRLAENIGRSSLALALQLPWTPPQFGLSLSSCLGSLPFTWVNALGVMFLANILYIKFKSK